MKRCFSLLVVLVLLLPAGNVFAAPSRAKLYVMIQDLQVLTTAMQATIDAQQVTITNLSSQLSTVQADTITGLGAYLRVEENEINGVVGPHVIFEGANVHIQDGSGTTVGNPTGLGNLIIGYNEEPATLLPGDRGGSHNFIMGREHKYLSNDSILHGWGGTTNAHASVILAGDGTVISSSYSAAIGGMNHVISGQGVAIGGNRNIVSGEYAVAVGGQDNIVAGKYSSILAGDTNSVTSGYSAIVSGNGNKLLPGEFSSGSNSAIIGSENATVSGVNAVTVGGYLNAITGRASTILGGESNSVSGDYSSIGGGINILSVNNHEAL